MRVERKKGTSLQGQGPQGEEEEKMTRKVMELQAGCGKVTDCNRDAEILTNLCKQNKNVDADNCTLDSVGSPDVLSSPKTRNRARAAIGNYARLDGGEEVKDVYTSSPEPAGRSAPRARTPGGGGGTYAGIHRGFIAFVGTLGNGTRTSDGTAAATPIPNDIGTTQVRGGLGLEAGYRYQPDDSRLGLKIYGGLKLLIAEEQRDPYGQILRPSTPVVGHFYAGVAGTVIVTPLDRIPRFGFSAHLEPLGGSVSSDDYACSAPIACSLDYYFFRWGAGAFLEIPLESASLVLGLGMRHSPRLGSNAGQNTYYIGLPTGKNTTAPTVDFSANEWSGDLSLGVEFK